MRLSRGAGCPTTRAEDLDDALLRPGRFDRKLFVPCPDMKGRRAILQAHATGKPLAEAGYTILHLQTALLPPRYKVSIVPRGQALGVTTLLPDEDQNPQSKKFLLEELLVLMGGWAAEKTFYDSTTSGAAGAFYGFLPITFFVTLAHILDLRTPPGRAMSYAMERCGELMCGLYRRIAFEVRLATL